MTRTPDYLFVVINAGCKEKDIKVRTHFVILFLKFDQHLREKVAASGLDVKLNVIETHALVALQG